MLRVPPHQLDFGDCLREILLVWLKQIDPCPTWQSLANAVRIINPSVAQQISHCTLDEPEIRVQK